MLPRVIEIKTNEAIAFAEDLMHSPKRQIFFNYFKGRGSLPKDSRMLFLPLQGQETDNLCLSGKTSGRPHFSFGVRKIKLIPGLLIQTYWSRPACATEKKYSQAVHSLALVKWSVVCGISYSPVSKQKAVCPHPSRFGRHEA